MLHPLLLLLALSADAAQPPAPAPIPALEEATSQVMELDAALFHAAFEGCDPVRLNDLLTEDYRMLHDRAGLAVQGRAGFVSLLEQQCAARAPGGANAGYRNRRLPVPGSRNVTQLGDWGVLEEGWHTFHEWRAETQSWEQVGGARYLHVWRWIAGERRFRLAESLSLDHG